MKNNLEIIREACIAANPAIMELGFGCEVRFKLYQELFVYVRQIKNDYHQVIKKWGDRITEVPDLNEVIILGRPIRLADVMKAMGTKEDFGYACDSSGQLLVCDLLETNEQWSPKFMFWNLLKDDLREQSEETLAFLAELFK